MHPIGEAARKSGVMIETIRYYEKEGITPAPPRAASGRRLYSPGAIAKLRFVRRCRDLGFPLAEIRALLALSANQAPICTEVKARSTAHLATVRRKIADLQRLEAALGALVQGCDSGQPLCPMLTSLLAD
ncbi:MAG: helix-turn-helix domain-containing protein [Paracoccaceae bacterium]|nr:helix-turn-helix domain-containing protein [Paracoccaceae bacterium]